MARALPRTERAPTVVAAPTAAKFTMRPNPFSRMWGTTSRHMWNTESRLVRITASQLALSIFLKVMSRVMPALLTSTSIGPTSATTCFAQATHESQLATSQG